RVPFEGESAGEILMKHLTSPPDLSKLPSVYVPVVAKALSKNPAHRFGNIVEMARAVEAVGGPRAGGPRPGSATPPPPRARAPRPRLRRPEPPPVVLPPVSLRGQLAELCGSMSLAAVLAVLFSVVWAAMSRSGDLTEIGACFFLTVAVCWAVLVPAKLWAVRGT